MHVLCYIYLPQFCFVLFKNLPEELAEMVHTINMATVNLEDRLSNQVYHYDRNARTLKLATDTPNKRLDGEVAEQQLVYEANKGPKR